MTLILFQQSAPDQACRYLQTQTYLIFKHFESLRFIILWNMQAKWSGWGKSTFFNEPKNKTANVVNTFNMIVFSIEMLLNCLRNPLSQFIGWGHKYEAATNFVSPKFDAPCRKSITVSRSQFRLITLKFWMHAHEWSGFIMLDILLLCFFGLRYIEGKI